MKEDIAFSSSKAAMNFSIVTTLRAGWLGLDSGHGHGGNFFLCHSIQTSSETHLPTSSAGVESVWGYTFTLPVHYHGMVLSSAVRTSSWCDI